MGTGRSGAGWLARLGAGDPRYAFVADLYLRALGAVVLVAGLSLWPQLPGLLGPQGMFPVGPFLQAVTEQVGGDRYRLFPTFSWFLGSGTAVLRGLSAATAAAGLLLLLGVLPHAALLVAWACYLSLVSVGRDFLSFQWDSLLLETLFFSLFLFAPRLRMRLRDRAQPLVGGLWLLRWLVFRLHFSSGCVKLASGDASWWGLTALQHHFETQPLPTWIGWYCGHLPAGLLKAATAAVLVVEIVVPFLIFGPPRVRRWGAGILAALQLLIALTGNYGFFNLLTLVLCLLLVDDHVWRRLLRRPPAAAEGPTPARRWRTVAVVGACLLVVPLSTIAVVDSLGVSPPWPAPLAGLYRVAAPWRLVNSYGLFAVMTTRRPEIVIEGSLDGQVWQAYGFPYKPGDPRRRPGFVAPYQPRLDWQMWFAALGSYRQQPWFIPLLAHLLQNTPEVVGLLADNPFPDEPPYYIRAALYNYTFTSLEERHRTGRWWHREFEGYYVRQLSARKRPRPGRR